MAVDLEDDEAPWLARARVGDRDAFAELVRRHQSRVRQQLRRLAGGDAALADDLAQDTFVQAWRSLGNFRGEARLSTWLHRIAFMRFLQHVRRPSPVVPAAEMADPQTGHDPRPHEDLRRDVERALRGLSPPQQQAVLHCFHLDLSHEEAAQVLGLPLGTLKSHLARAKARLREDLAAWSEEMPP